MGRTLTCKKEEELRSNPGKASLIERLRESVCESELSKTNKKSAKTQCQFLVTLDKAYLKRKCLTHSATACTLINSKVCLKITILGLTPVMSSFAYWQYAKRLDEALLGLTHSPVGCHASLPLLPAVSSVILC